MPSALGSLIYARNSSVVVLPFAVTGMLVVYSLKDAPFNAWHGLPEFICAAITLALHFWRRSMLISIVGGTVAYMFLIQKIF